MRERRRQERGPSDGAKAMVAEVGVCHVGGEGELRCSRAGKTWGDAREREAEPRSAGRRTGEADAR